MFEVGLKLPADYKDLVGEGVTLEFDHELLIYSPSDRRPAVELFVHVANASHAEALLRTLHPERHVDAVFPEPLGILAWGSDGGGAVYHWDTSHPDPDRWTVVITGRPIDGFIRERVGLTGYLAGLSDGSIEGAALSNWPKPDPELRPV